MMLSQKLKGGRESKTHLAAKEKVAAMVTGGHGYLLVSALEGGRWSTYRMDVSGCKAVTECAYPSGESVTDKNDHIVRHGRLPEMIFDVGIVKNGKIVAAVELSLSHWIDAKKTAKINASGLIVLEVHAYHEQWLVDDLARIECENLFLPVKPAVEFRRLRVGDMP